MKKLMAVALTLSLGLFTLGCGSKPATPAKTGGTSAAPATKATDTKAPVDTKAPAAPDKK